MYARNAYEAYQNNAVTTASPGELTLMLYNGCIKFIRKAKDALSRNDMEEKNRNIQKAQNIVTELIVTLNRDVPVAEQMLQMYDYMNRQLISANVKNDSKILDEVEGYAIEFRDTWKEVIRIQRQSQPQVGGRST